MVRKTKTMTDVLREAAEKDGRSLYALAAASGVPRPVLHRFLRGDVTGKKWGMTLMTATKLAAELGLELRPKAKAKSKKKRR